MTLLNEADAIYLGALAADRVYLGANLVWSSEPPPFAPTDIAGLDAWLDASQLGLAADAAVTSWPNLGAGADPTIVGTPAPIFKTAILNGLPVVRTAAGQGRLRGITSAIKNYTMLYVVRSTNAAGGARAFAGRYPEGSNYVIGYHGSSMNAFYDDGGFYGTPITVTTAWKIYGVDAHTPGGTYTARYFVDNTVFGNKTGGTGGLNTYYCLSGYSWTGTEETGAFDFAEVVIYDRKLSDAERTQVYDYLYTKWFVAPPVTGPTSSLLASYTPGSDRNDFTGEVGVRLGIGASPFTVSWLGVRKHPGTTGTRTLNLYEWFSGTVQRTATVDVTGAADNSYVWAPITPITLTAGGYYALLMVCTASGFIWSNPGAVSYTGMANVYDSYRTGGALYTGLLNNSFVGLDLGWS